MMTERTCPACGSVVAASTKSCQSCGTPLEDVVEESSVVTVSSVCSRCGAPATSPDQKFCAICGGQMSGAVRPAPAQASISPSPTGTVSAAGASVASSSESPTKTDMAQMRSRFDDFMGASVDVSSVGRDFDPRSIVLSGDNDPRLVEAFAFFNKVYLPSPKGTPIEVDEVLAPRVEPDEARPQRKERRVHSVRKGGFVTGELATKLNASAAPSVRMIESVREKALEQQSKGRKRRKAVLDEQ